MILLHLTIIMILSCNNVNNNINSFKDDNNVIVNLKNPSSYHKATM